MQQRIYQQGIQTKRLSDWGLSRTGGATLLLNAPKEDLSEEESAALKDFLGVGGNLVLCSSAGLDLPTLFGTLAMYGATFRQGMVVETQEGHYLADYKNCLLPDIMDASQLDMPYIDSAILMPLAHPIALAPIREGVTLKKLAATSAAAYVQAQVSSEIEQVDDTQAYEALSVAALIEDNNSGARIAWFASGEFLSEASDEVVGAGNTNMLLATLEWMYQDDMQIDLAQSTPLGSNLQMNTLQKGMYYFLLCIVSPLLLLGGGLFIAARRKKLSGA